MENYIIIGIIAVIVVIGVLYTVRHFKGESGYVSVNSKDDAVNATTTTGTTVNLLLRFQQPNLVSGYRFLRR